MSVVLLITRDVGEHVSGHADNDAAFDALVRYVDAHWTDAKLPAEAANLDPDKRIDLVDRGDASALHDRNPVD